MNWTIIFTIPFKCICWSWLLCRVIRNVNSLPEEAGSGLGTEKMQDERRHLVGQVEGCEKNYSSQLEGLLLVKWGDYLNIKKHMESGGL